MGVIKTQAWVIWAFAFGAAACGAGASDAAGASDGTTGGGAGSTAASTGGGSVSTGGGASNAASGGTSSVSGGASGGTSSVSSGASGGTSSVSGGASGGTSSVSSGSTTSGGGSATGSAGGDACAVFTPDDLWNTDISSAPVSATWTQRLSALVGDINIHPDFGAGFGIPSNIVPASQPLVPVKFDAYPDESDPGPYPFPDPSVARVEGTDDPTQCDGDCHLLAVQQGSCQLYEGYGCHYAGGWHCDNGAHWDLQKKSYGQRPVGWTSADAAGLPIYAGLARYEEAVAGEITHAIRFTVKCTRSSYVMPATHDAVPSSCDPNDPNAPPMGLRVRLKASFDESAFGPIAQTFLRAFKKYGLILADNGSNFYFQSEENPNWPDEINDLKRVPASAFEVIEPTQ